jgi:hypothetical protein
MSDFFAQVERELSLATARRAHLPWYMRGLPGLRGRLGRVPLTLIALALGGASTAVALAAGGVIFTGSPVRTLERPSATAGQGIPVRGGSRLLSLRVPDPAGGLPWGMRVVHTTRGLICVQVGRVENGRLGELGVDGAFGDDGLFHPLPEDALPDVLGGVSAVLDSDCEMPRATFAGDIVGLDINAATDPRAGVGPLADRREISFGMLGPHALSITYRSGSEKRTEPVLRGLGAYLIVQRYTSGRTLGSASETDGNEQPYDSFPATPNGALTAITYRFRKVCTVTGSGTGESSCGLTFRAPPHPPALPAVHPAIHASLQIHDGTVTGADISFHAPYPVRSAGEDYVLFMRTCPGLGGGSSRSDVARGGAVDIRMNPVALAVAFSCQRTITFRVEYVRTVYGLPAPTRIGTVSLSEPPGTHTRPLPPRMRALVRWHAATPGGCVGLGHGHAAVHKRVQRTGERDHC